MRYSGVQTDVPPVLALHTGLGQGKFHLPLAAGGPLLYGEVLCVVLFDLYRLQGPVVVIMEVVVNRVFLRSRIDVVVDDSGFILIRLGGIEFT